MASGVVEPRSESASGLRGLDGDYEGATAELDRQTNEVQIGHDRTDEQGVGMKEGGRLASLSRSGRFAYGASRNLLRR